LRKRDLGPLPGLILHNGFTPDEKNVAISTREGADRVVWVMDVDTGEKQELMRSA
jgi:hypothetical protein